MTKKLKTVKKMEDNFEKEEIIDEISESIIEEKEEIIEPVIEEKEEIIEEVPEPVVVEEKIKEEVKPVGHSLSRMMRRMGI